MALTIPEQVTLAFLYLIGYSGEDCPRSVIPSYVGLVDRVQGDGDIDMGGSKRVIVGGAELNFKRDHMEIQPLLQETGISKVIEIKRYSQLRLPRRHIEEESG